ncbi:hypothetical protein GGQ97_002207 [Sphingomonas kaistensis]|uniref:Uncharacterized protein n=1 Tax=Sphingomonas kaistensis TaxID=298708 RepID=A0A7X6BGF7_9SPHN|nr:hypothetical protein [Sphingomonas kaistensis]NJC06414.1 hypothetical protein [Sphingomonas kaistensis]
MTAYANVLLRLLLQRAGEDCNRIFLSSWKTVEWNSLTLDGERHRASFTIGGPDPLRFAALWLAGLSEAEFAMTRGFVADIEVIGKPTLREDGMAEVEIAALTLDD